MTTDLSHFLSLWLLRWRLQRAALWTLRGLAAGLAAGLGFSLVARLMPFQPVAVLITLSLASALAGAALAGGAAFFWPRRLLIAARYFDRRFGLAERTSTALELSLDPGTVPAWLVRDQMGDALAAARGVDLGRRLPFEFRRDEGLAILGLVAALALSLYLPNPQQAVLTRQQAVQQAIAEQITRVEAIREEIAENPDLTDQQKETLTQPLDEALRQLEDGRLTQEQAVSVLQSTEEQLQQLSDPQARQQAEALQQTGQNLAQGGSGPLRDFGQDLANGNYQAAAQDLANLDLSQLSGEELDALAAQLEAAAQDLVESNPELAGQLQAAADAIRDRDLARAQEALRDAARALRQAGAQIAQAQAAQQAAGQVAQGRQQVIRAGQGEQGRGGVGEQGSRGAEEQGQGQGSSQDEGQGGQGGGAGRGEGNGEDQGGRAETGPIGQENAPGDGGERGYEPIYSPYHLGGSGGPDVALPGSGEPGDEILSQVDANPETGQSVIPYNQVFPVYSDQAYQAINAGEVPVGLRQLVKDYFSSLEP